MSPSTTAVTHFAGRAGDHNDRAMAASLLRYETDDFFNGQGYGGAIPAAEPTPEPAGA